jgi:hypothetical protein
MYLMTRMSRNNALCVAALALLSNVAIVKTLTN